MLQNRVTVPGGHWSPERSKNPILLRGNGRGLCPARFVWSVRPIRVAQTQPPLAMRVSICEMAKGGVTWNEG